MKHTDASHYKNVDFWEWADALLIPPEIDDSTLGGIKYIGTHCKCRACAREGGKTTAAEDITISNVSILVDDDVDDGDENDDCQLNEVEPTILEYSVECSVERTRKRNSFRVCEQNKRARRLGLVGDLTMSQWCNILDEFNNCCAYCGRRELLELDHVVPVSMGGGTTCSNIAPACQSCNSLKRAQDPLLFLGKEELEDIMSRLERANP
jgi:5-methylcytosine-specific restriction endonuclease McrA